MRKRKKTQTQEIISKSSLNTTLLSHIGLSTTLADLALVMHITILLLLGAVTSDSSTNGSKSPLGAVLNTLAPVLKLTLSLLFLAGSVLLGSGAAQVLVSDQVADRLLGRADGLVPGSCVALRVVFGNGSGIRVGGERTQLGGCVGGISFGLAFFVLEFTLGLRGVSIVVCVLGPGD